MRTVASGAEAIDLWRRAPSDIVLCDLAMPQMDGFDVLKQIRQLDAAAGRTTPVIAVSAYASDEYRERCLRAGFQAHLAKPTRPGGFDPRDRGSAGEGVIRSQLAGFMSPSSVGMSSETVGWMGTAR